MNLVPGLRRIALYSAITSAILGSIGPVAFAHTQVKETLTVSFYGNGYPHAALNTIVSKFRAKYPQYNVKFDFITAGSWADYFNKIQTMIASGNAPDVSNIASEGVREFVDNGLVIPLDSYMKAYPDAMDDPSDYPAQLRNAFVVKGHNYGLGADWNNVVVHINTDMLKAAHLPMPPTNWSLNEFLRYAKALTGVTNGKQHYGFAVPNYWFGTEAWLYNNGASILNDSMTKATLESPNAVQIIQLFHDMIYKYHYSPVPSKLDPIQQLMSGQVGMIAMGRWPLGEYVPAKFKAVNVQFIPLMKRNQPEFGIASFMVLKSAKDPLAAYRLSMFLSSKFAQNLELSYSAIPSRTSVMKTDLPIGPVANWKVYEDSAKGAKQVQAPGTYSALQGIFDRYMSDIYSNQMDVKTALKQADQQMNAVLAGQP